LSPISTVTFVRPVNLGFCVFATLAKDSGGAEHRLQGTGVIIAL